MFTSYYGIKDI